MSQTRAGFKTTRTGGAARKWVADTGARKTSALNFNRHLKIMSAINSFDGSQLSYVYRHSIFASSFSWLGWSWRNHGRLVTEHSPGSPLLHSHFHYQLASSLPIPVPGVVKLLFAKTIIIKVLGDQVMVLMIRNAQKFIKYANKNKIGQAKINIFSHFSFYIQSFQNDWIY